MTDEQRDARAGEDARARDSATRDVVRDVKGEEEVVDAEVVDGPSAAEEADGNGAADQVERDLDELSAAKRERDEYLELAQRTRADFENYRKRVAKETSDALARGKAELARQLLPVIDNLERALQSGEKFDPEQHEALSAQPAEGTESGVVLETVEKGYRLDGQVLRPARVVVSK